MPKTYHTAAKSTHEMASKRRGQGLLTGLIAIGAIFVIYFLLTNSKALGIGGTGILILLCLIRIIPDQFDNYSRRQEKLIKRADRGAAAEEDIADILELLDDSFVVVHDVESPYGNIDHIVLSQKGGLILLETKSHHGTVTTSGSEIMVNGHSPEKDFIQQTLSNSMWLREEINGMLHVQPWITPMIVFTNAFVKYSKPVKGVKILNKKFMLNTLQSVQSQNAANKSIWINREQIVDFLTGDNLASKINQEANDDEKTCPKCGKVLVLRVAKGGVQIGKSFMVCPDYPKCNTAIPIKTV